MARKTVERRRAHHFVHLIDRFQCARPLALNRGNLIDGNDGEIDFKTGLGSIRVGEVHRLDRDLAPRADGSGDLLGEQFLLGFPLAWP